MQVPKISLLICVLALGASMAIRAADTPAQAAARAALEAKLKELNEQTPPADTAVDAPVVKKTALEAAKPATKVKTTPAPVKNDVALKPVASESVQAKAAADKKAKQATADAKARQDAEKAAAELKAKKETQAAAEAKAAADKKAKQAAADAKAKQDAAKAAADLKAKKEAQAAAEAKAAAAKKASEAYYPGKDLGLKKIDAPALPITTSKGERLQALLEKYKADKLSPEDYHKQRSVILAEP